MPANIFFGTGIPTIIVVLKKKRATSDVLIIDASKGFSKVGKNNVLRASDIKKIADTVIGWRSIDRYSRVVSQEEIRRNEYNLNIPRYVDSSDAAETWDIYASMFGGIPKSEIALFEQYWDTFTGLKAILFTESETPYCGLAVDDIEKAIKETQGVIGFKKKYEQAFGDFEELLKGELIEKMMELNIGMEESVLAGAIFTRLEKITLVDKYSVFQVLDDEWAKIAVDLEILQTEGLGAARRVNPNMVLKKKDGKDQEVQDGYAGHVIPFALVQSTILKEEALTVKQKEERLAEIQSSYEEIIDSLTEEEKDSDVLNEAKDAFAAAAVGKQIKEMFGSLVKAMSIVADYDEDAFERKLVAVQQLIDEEKELKSQLKKDSTELHLRTKETIENLTNDQVIELLEDKWIKPLMTAICTIPGVIITDFVSRIRALADKYAVTYAELAQQIAETKSSLSDLIDGLTGSEYDMKGLGEFQALLRGE